MAFVDEEVGPVDRCEHPDVPAFKKSRQVVRVGLLEMGCQRMEGFGRLPDTVGGIGTVLAAGNEKQGNGTKEHCS
jgi:hypothetical protein